MNGWYIFVIIMVIPSSITQATPPSTKKLIDTEVGESTSHELVARPSLLSRLTGLFTRKRKASVESDVSHSTDSIEDDWEVTHDLLGHARSVLDGVRENAGDVFSSSPSLSLCKPVDLNSMITIFEQVRELLCTYQSRIDPSFSDSYHETIEKNFAGCDIEASHVYPYLGCDDLEKAVKLPNEHFKLLISQREKDAGTEQEKKLIRQIGYVFRNDETKKIFDIYVSQGKDALNALYIDQAQADELDGHLVKIIEAKIELQRYQQELKKAAASSAGHDAAEKQSRTRGVCIII